MSAGSYETEKDQQSTEIQCFDVPTEATLNRHRTKEEIEMNRQAALAKLKEKAPTKRIS